MRTFAGPSRLVAIAMSCLILVVAEAHAANSSAFVSQNVPGVMVRGQTYSVSVTMQNTGTTTWTTASNYHLGSQNPQDNTTWGLTRALLPTGVSIAPGTNATFTFNVTAPTTAGVYNFQWRMVQDGVEWFGVNSTNFTVKVGLNDASFVSQSVPTVMVPGQTYAVSVTMQNSGGTTWTPGAAYKLGSDNAQDNTRWGTNRVYMPDGTSVAPGANFTFSFNVTAPTTPGSYNFQWRMVQDGVQWFGTDSTNVVVKDGLNDAHFVSASVPTVMSPGQTAAVSITLQNTGGSTWSAANGYKLGSQNPQDNTTWGTNRVALPNTVAPGASVTIAFNVTAPSTPGTYNFQWQMVQDNVGWFGEFSLNVAVRVGLDNAQFVSQSVPQIVVPGQSYSVSVTMQNSGSTTWSPGTFSLGSQNPQDNNNWGLTRVPLTGTVAPGANATFNFNITAPSTPGIYNFQWRMVAGDLGWFGASTTNVAVQDGVDDAAFVSQQVPSAMTPGQTYAASVTFQNAGTTTWNSAGVYRLLSQNPLNNSTWGISQVDLPAPVAPGASITFNFNVTAPSAAGTYNFQWQMAHGSNVLFGAPSTNVSVLVNSTAAANLYFIEVDHLNTPRAIEDQNGNTVWRWDQGEPFGVTQPNADPDGDGITFDFPLRFPGQYADRETGISYNMRRDYDPFTGRYDESDPMGLRGGINTYLSVKSSPLRYADPRGLDNPGMGPYDPSTHDYSWKVFRCLGDCSAKTMRELLCNPAPGVNPGMPVQSGDINTVSIGGIDLGPIVTVVDSDSNSIVNTTMPGHILNPGKVRRQVVVEGGATWVVNTGTGSGFNPLNLNSLLAPIVWGGQSPLMQPAQGCPCE